jgi:hypothetical protein
MSGGLADVTGSGVARDVALLACGSFKSNRNNKINNALAAGGRLARLRLY